MADREVVIKIPEDEYNIINDIIKKSTTPMTQVEHLIANGTLLPKGCDIQCIIPKRVDVQKWIDTKCPNPNCDCELSTHHYDGYYFFKNKPNFCPVCGQALLWEESEED